MIRQRQYSLMPMFVLVSLAGFLGATSLGDPAEDLKRGQDLARTGDCDAALKVLTQITDPSVISEALSSAAVCYRVQKNWSEAIKCYERILTLPSAQLREKDVMSSIMDCHLAANNTSQAYAYLEKLSSQYPDDIPRFHYVLGRRFYWMHQYADAVKELRQGIKMPKSDPEAKDACQKFINCSLSAMDWDGALAYLPTLVRDYPDSVPEVVGKQLDRWKFKIPQAIEIVEKASKEIPGDTTGLRIGLADCYVSVRNWGKSAEVLDSVPADRRDRSPDWHAVMAKCRWGQNRRPEAITELKRAIELGGNVELKKLLMDYYRSEADWESMLAQAQLLEKDWPQNTAEWLMNQGWAYLDMKEYAKAVPKFREAITRFPDHRFVVRGSLVSLAECLYRLGKKDEALKTVNDYYASRSELRAEYYLVYAQTMYYGARDYAQSEAYLRKLLSQYPHDPLVSSARRFLADVAETARDWGGASEALAQDAAAIPAWREWDKVGPMARLADSYFNDKKYGQAADTYKQLLKINHVLPEVRARVLYRLALSQHELGFEQSAVVYLQELIRSYPDEPPAREARGALLVWSGGVQSLSGKSESGSAE